MESSERASSAFGFIRKGDQAPGPLQLRRSRSDQLSTLRDIELAEAKKRRHQFVENPYKRELSASELALRNRQVRNAALHRKTRLAYAATTMEVLDKTDVVKLLPPAPGKPPRPPRAEGAPGPGAGREHFNTVLLEEGRSEAGSEDEEAGKLPPNGRSLSAPSDLMALPPPTDSRTLASATGVEIRALDALGRKLDLINSKRIVPVSYGTMDEVMSEARLSFPAFEAALRALRAHCGCEEHAAPLEAQWARYEGLFERLAAAAHSACERSDDAVARARRRRKEAEAAAVAAREAAAGVEGHTRQLEADIGRLRAELTRAAAAAQREEEAGRERERAAQEAARAAREEADRLRGENESLKRLAYSNSFSQWRRERVEAGLARPPSAYLPPHRELPPPVKPPTGPPSTLVNVRTQRKVVRRVRKRRPPPAPQTQQNVAFFLTQDKDQAAEKGREEDEWTEEEVEEEVQEDVLEQRPPHGPGAHGAAREPPLQQQEPSSSDVHRAALAVTNRFAEERERQAVDAAPAKRAALSQELIELFAADGYTFDIARAMREFDPETLEAMKASRARAKQQGDHEQDVLEVAVQESEDVLREVADAEREREELLRSMNSLVHGVRQQETLQRYGRLAETLLRFKAQLAERAAQLAERAAELDFRSKAPKDLSIEQLIAWKRSRKERAAAAHGAGHGEQEDGSPSKLPGAESLHRMIETIRSTTEAEAAAAEAAAAAAAAGEEEAAEEEQAAAEAAGPGPEQKAGTPKAEEKAAGLPPPPAPPPAEEAGEGAGLAGEDDGAVGLSLPGYSVHIGVQTEDEGDELAAQREKSLRRVEEVVVKAAHLLRKGFKMKEKDAKEKAKPVAVVALIDDVYRAKLTEERKQQRATKLPLADFLLEHLTATYGLRNMAEKQFLMVLATVIAMGDHNAKIGQFGRMLKGYNQPAQDFFLEAYEFVKGPAASVGPPLESTEDVDWVPLSRLEHVVRNFFSYVSPETVQHIVAEVRAHAVPIAPEERKACKHPAMTNETHKGDLHQFLGLAVGHWVEENERRRKWLQQLFKEGDLNRDGVLQFPEFRDIVRKVDPQADERLLLRAFSDATAIPQERFADIMQRVGLSAWRRSAPAAAPHAAHPASPPGPAGTSPPRSPIVRSVAASPPRSPAKGAKKP